MTKDELLENAIYWFKIIDEDLMHLTTGNLPHNAATTRGRAKCAFEFLEKHKNDEESQSHWKPSDEQLEALLDSIQGFYACKDKSLLLDLYEQLKKLREE